MATDFCRRSNATARWAATVVFPVPPFCCATVMIRPAMRIGSGAHYCTAISARQSWTCTAALVPARVHVMLLEHGSRARGVDRIQQGAELVTQSVEQTSEKRALAAGAPACAKTGACRGGRQGAAG